MSTILYRNAVLLLSGVELTGALHDLSVDYSAEILDRTTFGADTRIKRGGLFTGKVDGKGFFDTAIGIEGALFAEIGNSLVAATSNPAYQSAALIEDAIFIVFPDGVTEGSTVLGAGYAMKGVVGTFNIGAQVGQQLDITFAAESRGIGA